MKRRNREYFQRRRIERFIRNYKHDQCGEFPHFGARYPDATCIDGYLWDLDSYEEIDGQAGLSSGGDSPCPFCMTEDYIKDMIDNEIPLSRIFAHLRFISNKYGCPTKTNTKKVK